MAQSALKKVEVGSGSSESVPVEIVESSPWKAGGVFDLTPEIRKCREILRKVDELLEGGIPVVSSADLITIIHALEKGTEAERKTTANYLKGIASNQSVHMGLINVWQGMINSLSKLVKTGGDHRLVKEERVTTATLNRYQQIIMKAIIDNVKDDDTLLRINNDIKNNMPQMAPSLKGMAETDESLGDF